MSVTPEPLLTVEELHVEVLVRREPRVVIQRVDLRVARGEALGLVGESGSGKSLTARSIMRLLPEGAQAQGSIRLEGREILTLKGQELREVRRAQMAMIHQSPRDAINPVRTIGDFLTEGLRDRPKKERFDIASEALEEVGIADPARRFRQYPHQLSGGLLQRVMIAGMLIPKPALVIADEPTTALDVTSQSEVMAVLRDLQDARGVGMIFITHDIDLAAAVTDRLSVMYAGVIVETGSTATMQRSPLHPYTAGLMASRPSTTNVVRLKTIPGRPVAAFETGEGCVFASRCPFAEPLCLEERPLLEPMGGHEVACHRVSEIREQVLTLAGADR